LGEIPSDSNLILKLGGLNFNCVLPTILKIVLTEVVDILGSYN